VARNSGRCCGHGSLSGRRHPTEHASQEASYVAIDDTAPERTHLFITVNHASGSVIELIEQYRIKDRVGAYAMARRLAKLLDLPLKVLDVGMAKPGLSPIAIFQVPHDAVQPMLGTDVPKPPRQCGAARRYRLK
jgi:hypothetical protein